MNYLLTLSVLIVSINCGVLKNTEDQPIIHEGTPCGSTKCPNNYRCELPIASSDCDNEDGCSQIAKCVPIPVPKPKCEDNEELKECGSMCEPTCDNQNIECAPTCLTNVCQCKNGFVRDSVHGKCVQKDNCSKCTLECPENEKCEFVEVSCEQKPCQTVDVCVSKDNGNLNREE
ncbi:unnamed protein product [Caenorhabditis brenneri]